MSVILVKERLVKQLAPSCDYATLQAVTGGIGSGSVNRFFLFSCFDLHVSDRQSDFVIGAPKWRYRPVEAIQPQGDPA
jgi:hypothetical protein